MKSVKTLVITLVLGLAAIVYAADGSQPMDGAECCVAGASCCTGGGCCVDHKAR